jgi:hypothetical protein
MKHDGEKRRGKLPRYGGGSLDTRLRAVVPVVLLFAGLGVIFLWLGGIDLFDGRWERLDVANAVMFAAAVASMLAALIIMVGWVFEHAERSSNS